MVGTGIFLVTLGRLVHHSPSYLIDADWSGVGLSGSDDAGAYRGGSLGDSNEGLYERTGFRDVEVGIVRSSSAVFFDVHVDRFNDYLLYH